jgi:hypothetical protein
MFSAVLVTALVSAVHPATAATNPFKAFGAVKQAWKESDEAQLALNYVRRVGQKSVTDWRNSKGASCAWRSVSRTYCTNAYATALTDITLYFDGMKVGQITKGSFLSISCMTPYKLYVRVLWPTPLLPSKMVEKVWLRFLPGSKLPYC